MSQRPPAHRPPLPTFRLREDLTEEELITTLYKGAFLLKHGRSGRPKVHFFRLSLDGFELRWRSSRSGAVRAVNLATVTEITPGQNNDIFRRYPVRDNATSFSLRYRDDRPGAVGSGSSSSSGTARTLDLTCQDESSFGVWLTALNMAVQRARDGVAGTSTAKAADRGFRETANMAMPPGDLFVWGGGTRLVPAKPPHSLGGPSSSTRGAPPGSSSSSISKLLLGHTSHSYQAATSASSGSTTRASRQHSAGRVPALIPGNSSIHAVAAAIGHRHMACVSSEGQLFVYGEGANGKLGRGHVYDAVTPSRLQYVDLSGCVKTVSCGDEYTIVVTIEGKAFLMGRVPAMEQANMVIPTPVASLVKVTSVACGPFHWAAVAEGRLWTAGDGWGGKLGHGDEKNRAQPTLVRALPQSPVLAVACGVWHTACVVQQDPGSKNSTGASEETTSNGGSDDAPSPSSSREPFSLPSPLAKLHHRRASSFASFGSVMEVGGHVAGALQVPAYHEGEGGVLYTWGGVGAGCLNVQDGVKKQNPAGSGAIDVVGRQASQPLPRDTNRGCLGHGTEDLHAGQMIPLPVQGALRSRAVRAVAAGLHLTVCTTTAGEVFQMGCTGATPGRGIAAPWEGATMPELVRGNLSGYFADTIACGMHHVVVLGRPIEKKTGKPAVGNDGSAGTVVFAWGRGDRGQLGHGRLEDSAVPIVVESLRGKKVQGLACGGATTAAIVEHDVNKWEPEGGKEAVEGACRALLGMLQPPKVTANASSTNVATTEASRASRSFSTTMGFLGRSSFSSRSNSVAVGAYRPPTAPPDLSRLSSGSLGSSSVVSIATASDRVWHLYHGTTNVDNNNNNNNHNVDDNRSQERVVISVAAGTSPPGESSCGAFLPRRNSAAMSSRQSLTASFSFSHADGSAWAGWSDTGGDEDALSSVSTATVQESQAASRSSSPLTHQLNSRRSPPHKYLAAAATREGMAVRGNEEEANEHATHKLRGEIAACAGRFRETFKQAAVRQTSGAAGTSVDTGTTDDGVNTGDSRRVIGAAVAAATHHHQHAAVTPPSINISASAVPFALGSNADSQHGNDPLVAPTASQVPPLQAVLVERQKELDRQRSALAAWAEELHARENALTTAERDFKGGDNSASAESTRSHSQPCAGEEDGSLTATASVGGGGTPTTMVTWRQQLDEGVEATFMAKLSGDSETTDGSVSTAPAHASFSPSLLRIRFSRSRFDSGAASEWYRRRQDGILAAASIPSPQVPSPAQRRRRTSGNTLSFDATELKNLHGHEDMEDMPSTNDPGSPPANAVMRRSSVEEWHTPGADVPTGDEDQENKVASPGDVSAPGARVERSEDGSSPSICGLKSRDAEEKCSVDEENLSMVSACSGGSEEEGIVQADSLEAQKPTIKHFHLAVGGPRRPSSAPRSFNLDIATEEQASFSGSLHASTHDTHDIEVSSSQVVGRSNARGSGGLLKFVSHLTGAFRGTNTGE